MIATAITISVDFGVIDQHLVHDDHNHENRRQREHVHDHRRDRDVAEQPPLAEHLAGQPFQAERLPLVAWSVMAFLAASPRLVPLRQRIEHASAKVKAAAPLSSRILGWERRSQVPSEAKFSRASRSSARSTSDNPSLASGSFRWKPPSIYPAALSTQTSPRTPSASTGGSRTNPTTRGMSLSAKTPRGFEPIPESSPDSGPSRTISQSDSIPLDPPIPLRHRSRRPQINIRDDPQ